MRFASSAIRMKVPMPSSSASADSSSIQLSGGPSRGPSAEPSKEPETFRSLRISDGSRPASSAASSIASLPAAKISGLQIGEARQPAVGFAADEVQHPGLVGTDPDADVMDRFRSPARLQ